MRRTITNVLNNIQLVEASDYCMFLLWSSFLLLYFGLQGSKQRIVPFFLSGKKISFHFIYPHRLSLTPLLFTLFISSCSKESLHSKRRKREEKNISLFPNFCSSIYNERTNEKKKPSIQSFFGLKEIRKKGEKSFFGISKLKKMWTTLSMGNSLIGSSTKRTRVKNYLETLRI